MSDSDETSSSKNNDKSKDEKPQRDKKEQPLKTETKLSDKEPSEPPLTENVPPTLESVCTLSFESELGSINENEPQKSIDGKESNERKSPPTEKKIEKEGLRSGKDSPLIAIMEGPGASGQDDSVRINIEELGQQSGGDKDAPVKGDDETRINIDEEVMKKKMEEIINLEEDAPKMVRENIRPPKSIWAFPASGFMENRVPLQGEKLDYDPSRNDFVRKVFLIVFIMLLATFFYALVVAMVPPLREFFTNPIIALFLFICSMVVSFIMHYVMYCSECSRIPPCNYICLCISVIALGTMTTVVVLRYRAEIVLLAFLITAGTVLFCLCLAMTPFDFTRFMLYFMVIAVAFSLMAMAVMMGMFMFKMYYKPVHIVILAVSIIISVISLIMQLQMILGGRAVELGVDDYALGAYMLYNSIVHMFLQILRLLALVMDEDLF